MSIILDLLILAVFGLCIWQGYKRGLISAVFGIVIIIIALYISNLLANTYSTEFSPMIKSFISGYVDTKLEEAKDEVVEEEYLVYSIEDIITMNPGIEDTISRTTFLKLGICERSAGKLSDRAQEHKNDMGDNLANSIAGVASNTMAYLLVLCVAMVLIVIIFTVLANITNITLRIPGKKKLDAISGSVMGAFRALLIVSTVAWVVGFLGILISAETVEKTVLLEFFVNRNIISAFLKI